MKKAFLLVLLPSFLLTGCRKREEAPVEVVPDTRPNVVLITLDTTRADRLGVYGHDKASTGTLDALAAAGQRFDRAYAPVPLTIPSHSTLFTGLNPYRHGVRSNSDEVLDGRFTTMAELFQQAGYDTAASIAAFVTQRSWGFDQGFDAYFDHIPRRARTSSHNQWREERPAQEVLDDALGWLEGRQEGKPFFLWVHLFDAHMPWEAPPPFSGEEIHPYDAELAYMDNQVERLVSRLEGTDTLWVVAGDHGEGLGGHTEVDHGLFLYNGTQRIPFFLSGAGVEPSVVDQPVGLVDVLPTVLQTLGMDIPPDLEGRAQPGGAHPIYMESYQLRDRFGYAPHVAVVDGKWKLIDTPSPELYDQQLDVRDQENLAEANPEVVSTLRAALAAFGATPPGEGGGDLDPETLARLTALGYVSGNHAIVDGDAPDPKDRIDVIKLMQQASRARRAGRKGQEAQFLRNAIALDPHLVSARLRLARMLASSGKQEEALASVQEALNLNPESNQVLMNAIVIYGRAQRFEDATALCDTVLARDPDNLQINETCLTILVNSGQGELALSRGLEFLESHPEASSIAGFMGVFLARLRRYDEAAPLLIAGLEATFPRRRLRHYLALMWMAQDRPGEAMESLRGELLDWADNTEARQLLVRLLGEEKRFDEQLEQVDFLLAREPESVLFLHARAQTLFNMDDLDGTLLALEAGLRQAPDDPRMLLLLANLQARQGQPELAQETFARASALQEALDALEQTEETGPRTPGAP